MTLQLKIGAWKTRGGDRVNIIAKTPHKLFPWSDSQGWTWYDDGCFNVNRDPVAFDIIGPWEEPIVTTNPNPGPGYRLATEQDVGREDVEFYDDFDASNTPVIGRNSVRTRLKSIIGGLFLKECLDDCGTWYEGCRWKYARVPLDKSAFVPGEWYAVGEKKCSYVGLNQVNNLSVFSTDDGKLYAFLDTSDITPWIDTLAFRMCSAWYRGEFGKFTVAGRNAIRSDGECMTLSQLSQIRWHDEEGK